MDHDEKLELTHHFTELANNNDNDDLIDSLNQLTRRVQIGPKPSQKASKATKLCPQRITAIAKETDSGKLRLPDLALPHDTDYVAVWALVDSGSSIPVANAEQILPSAKVQPPPKGHTRFEVTSGDKLRHNGFIYTDVRTQEGDRNMIRWKHAKVAPPILSTHGLARNGAALEDGEYEGCIKKNATGNTTRLIQTAGVYFVR